MIGYKSKKDPNPPLQEEETFELEINNKLEYNNIGYRVTNVDQPGKKVTIRPLIPSDGDALEIGLDLASRLSEEYYKEPQ